MMIICKCSKKFFRLEQNHLKVNLEKCVFGNQEVSYLGFTLTPQGIKPGRNKLQEIKDIQPPTNIKMVRSFVGLCNFFRTHNKDFAIIASPLFKVTRKDSGYKNGPLPPDALHAFKILQQLISDPVMAFPRADRQYALITDAATGTADSPGGLGAILTQIDNNGNHFAISFASRQLKDHEKNFLHSCLKLLRLYGEWKYSMNTCVVSNAFFSQTTNLLKNWVICTQKC
jgi:hypothetical protein